MPGDNKPPEDTSQAPLGALDDPDKLDAEEAAAPTKKTPVRSKSARFDETENMVIEPAQAHPDDNRRDSSGSTLSVDSGKTEATSKSQVNKTIVRETFPARIQEAMNLKDVITEKKRQIASLKEGTHPNVAGPKEALAEATAAFDQKVLPALQDPLNQKSLQNHKKIAAGKKESATEEWNKKRAELAEEDKTEHNKLKRKQEKEMEDFWADRKELRDNCDSRKAKKFRRAEKEYKSKERGLLRLHAPGEYESLQEKDKAYELAVQTAKNDIQVLENEVADTYRQLDVKMKDVGMVAGMIGPESQEEVDKLEAYIQKGEDDENEEKGDDPNGAKEAPAAGLEEAKQEDPKTEEEVSNPTLDGHTNTKDVDIGSDGLPSARRSSSSMSSGGHPSSIGNGSRGRNADLSSHKTSAGGNKESKKTDAASLQVVDTARPVTEEREQHTLSSMISKKPAEATEKSAPTEPKRAPAPIALKQPPVDATQPEALQQAPVDASSKPASLSAASKQAAIIDVPPEHASAGPKLVASITSKQPAAGATKQGLSPQSNNLMDPPQNADEDLVMENKLAGDLNEPPMPLGDDDEDLVMEQKFSGDFNEQPIPVGDDDDEGTSTAEATNPATVAETSTESEESVKKFDPQRVARMAKLRRNAPYSLQTRPKNTPAGSTQQTPALYMFQNPTLGMVKHFPSLRPIYDQNNQGRASREIPINDSKNTGSKSPPMDLNLEGDDDNDCHGPFEEPPRPGNGKAMLEMANDEQVDSSSEAPGRKHNLRDRRKMMSAQSCQGTTVPPSNDQAGIKSTNKKRKAALQGKGSKAQKARLNMSLINKRSEPEDDKSVRLEPERSRSRFKRTLEWYRIDEIEETGAPNSWSQAIRDKHPNLPELKKFRNDFESKKAHAIAFSNLEGKPGDTHSSGTVQPGQLSAIMMEPPLCKDVATEIIALSDQALPEVPPKAKWDYSQAELIDSAKNLNLDTPEKIKNTKKDALVPILRNAKGLLLAVIHEDGTVSWSTPHHLKYSTKFQSNLTEIYEWEERRHQFDRILGMSGAPKTEHPRSFIYSHNQRWTLEDMQLRTAVQFGVGKCGDESSFGDLFKRVANKRKKSGMDDEEPTKRKVEQPPTRTGQDEQPPATTRDDQPPTTSQEDPPRRRRQKRDRITRK